MNEQEETRLYLGLLEEARTCDLDTTPEFETRLSTLELREAITREQRDRISGILFARDIKRTADNVIRDLEARNLRIHKASDVDSGGTDTEPPTDN